jgi:O-antigen/teichoic acid export membrane protein
VQRSRQAAGQKFLRNVAANYAGTLLNVSLPLLTLPIYLKHLGADNFGLVSFVTFFVSILSILDAGCSQALVKEFANRAGASSENTNQSSCLLFGYERVYVLFALSIAVLTIPFANIISSRWLNLGDLPHEIGSLAVYCAIALFVVQFPGSIYRTVLSARQQQVQLNKIQASFMLLRHAVSVVLVLVQPKIHFYLLWQVLCTCMETTYMSTKAWKEVGKSRSISRWDSDIMRTTFRFAVVMVASVLLGAATNMIDKFLITAQLPISQLGYYGIASSVSFGLLRLSYPIFTAVLPRLAELQGDTQATLKINLRLLATVTVGLFVILFLYLVAGQTVLSFWLKNESATSNVATVLDVLLIACALNIYYNIGYTNWVAAGKSQIILSINIASFFVALIASPIAIDRFGLVGAAAALVLMNSIGACASLVWLAKFHIKNH